MMEDYVREKEKKRIDIEGRKIKVKEKIDNKKKGKKLKMEIRKEEVRIEERKRKENQMEENIDEVKLIG